LSQRWCNQVDPDLSTDMVDNSVEESGDPGPSVKNL
jgi:hypothetical protein